MNELNKLERAVLDWVSEHSDNSVLASQLESAVLVDREWTKVGFHIDIKVDISCTAVDSSFPITGPLIESPSLEHGAGSMIWGKDGFVNGIEMFAYGDEFDEEIHNFTLQKCPTTE